MPTAIEAQNALIAHLQAMSGGVQIAHPNGVVVTELPRVVVEVPAPAQRNLTVKGRAQGEAEIMARVETNDGEFAGEANDIAVAILNHFSPVQRLDGATIIEAPTVRGSYRENGVYYVPVIIRGRYYTQ